MEADEAKRFLQSRFFFAAQFTSGLCEIIDREHSDDPEMVDRLTRVACRTSLEKVFRDAEARFSSFALMTALLEIEADRLAAAREWRH